MAPRFINIKTVEELERLTGRPCPVEQGEALRQVMERFPVRLTPHLVELCRRSPAVAAQFLPDPRELQRDQGQEYCFKGLLPTGVAGVERMYPDRCIIMPRPACPAYCRFCFRKFYEHGGAAAPLSRQALAAAVDYVAAHPELREVLITGGEPAQDHKALEFLLVGLRRLDHVGPIRVACRSLVTAPDVVDHRLVQLLRDHQHLSRGQPVEVAAHINHTDELTPPTEAALCALRLAGIHVYNQAVLLRGINSTPRPMLSLLGSLRRLGVEAYNIFFGGPVQGMDHLRPSLGEALALKAALRRHATGRANPHLIVTTRLGKVELGVDGQVVEREPCSRWVWISTPYTLTGLRELSPDFALPADARLEQDGTITMRYLDGPPRPLEDAR